MKTYIYEHPTGVCLEVKYELEGGMFCFDSVRLIGEQYRAVGPNLGPMLDPLVMLEGPVQEDGSCALGQKFLSLIIEEAMNEQGDS